MSSGRYISTSEKGILDWLGIDSENIPRNALSQTTYYTCIKTLSEALGKMPLKLYQRTKDGIQRHTMTDTLRLLSLRPNEYMSSTIFGHSAKCAASTTETHSYGWIVQSSQRAWDTDI